MSDTSTAIAQLVVQHAWHVDTYGVASCLGCPPRHIGAEPYTLREHGRHVSALIHDTFIPVPRAGLETEFAVRCTDATGVEHIERRDSLRAANLRADALRAADARYELATNRPTGRLVEVVTHVVLPWTPVVQPRPRRRFLAAVASGTAGV